MLYSGQLTKVQVHVRILTGGDASILWKTFVKSGFDFYWETGSFSLTRTLLFYVYMQWLVNTMETKLIVNLESQGNDFKDEP